MYLPDYNCALCSHHTDETAMHLFWDCPFAMACWDPILPDKQRGVSSHDEISLAMNTLPSEIAFDIIIMGCWGLWSVRNDKIFIYAPPHLNTWKFYLKEGLWASELRAKAKKIDKIRTWVTHMLGLE